MIILKQAFWWGAGITLGVLSVILAGSIILGFLARVGQFLVGKSSPQERGKDFMPPPLPGGPPNLGV